MTQSQTIANISFDTSNIQRDYIEVTADAMNRFYQGVYLLRKIFEPNMHLPETLGLMKIAITEQVLKPISRTYPIFSEFTFELTEHGSMIGTSDVANTILGALVKIARTPISEDVAEEQAERNLVTEFKSMSQSAYDEQSIEYDETEYDETEYDETEYDY